MISMSRVTAVYRHDFTIPPVKQALASRRTAIDWYHMHQQAALGVIPNPAYISVKDRTVMRDRVYALARQGKIEVLQALEIGNYNSRVKAIARYRDICVEALQARGNRT